MASINVTVNKIKLDADNARASNNILRVEFSYIPTSGVERTAFDKVIVNQPILFTVVEWELAIRAAITTWATGQGHTVSRVMYLGYINSIVSL